jgi:hypothetical protein
LSTHQEDSVEDLNQLIGNLADTWGEGENIVFIRDVLRIAHFACNLQRKADTLLHGADLTNTPLVVPSTEDA